MKHKKDKSPLGYYKKDIDYDYKQAYNKDLKASARLHYLENARHDKDSAMKMHHSPMKAYGSDLKMKHSPMEMKHSPMKAYGSEVKMKTNQDGGGYAAKNPAAPAKQLKKMGSVLSKHMKSQ